MGQCPKVKCRNAEAFSMSRTTASITLVLVQEGVKSTLLLFQGPEFCS